MSQVPQVQQVCQHCLSPGPLNQITPSSLIYSLIMLMKAYISAEYVNSQIQAPGKAERKVRRSFPVVLTLILVKLINLLTYSHVT